MKRIPKEIFKITPEYKKLSLEKKFEILMLLIQWVGSEITKLRK
jgi:hypothetical protein